MRFASVFTALAPLNSDVHVDETESDTRVSVKLAADQSNAAISGTVEQPISLTALAIPLQNTGNIYTGYALHQKIV